MRNPTTTPQTAPRIVRHGATATGGQCPMANASAAALHPGPRLLPRRPGVAPVERPWHQAASEYFLG
jgi:hypothetical protein